jgi:hypothetical protein
MKAIMRIATLHWKNALKEKIRMIQFFKLLADLNQAILWWLCLTSWTEVFVVVLHVLFISSVSSHYSSSLRSWSGTVSGVSRIYKSTASGAGAVEASSPSHLACIVAAEHFIS